MNVPRLMYLVYGLEVADLWLQAMYKTKGIPYATVSSHYLQPNSDIRVQAMPHWKRRNSLGTMSQTTDLKYTGKKM